MNAPLALPATQLGHLLPLADLDQNKVTPGLLGFVVFAAIGGAVWLLMKNMNKQFQKVTFEEQPKPGDQGGQAEPGDPEGSADPAPSGKVPQPASGAERPKGSGDA